ncbi:D-alanyl-D-alanine carboxypeptidase-like protein [Motilibacter peucedani]|uniref:D-alanyl-D-alanine carboxypeptidase-like protein n=1 Tax=Motilibacter peucedani TaxID=598650 RepID=A0A420XUE5_9ACTN|nr:M15 family metallopeptidase [Motilibacter peucedani]RKS80473.1 D-alanyl-D-alanine carboxypeptidase-like protein [Motilibacter peucedani]
MRAGRGPGGTRLVAAAVAVAVGVLLPAGPARAQDAVIDTVAAPALVHRGVPTVVTAVLHADAPAGVVVVLERRPGDAETWTAVAEGTTDAGGAVSIRFVPAGSNLYRLRSASPSATSATFPVLTEPAPSTLALSARRSVRSDTTWRPVATWTTSDGLPVPGTLLLQQRAGQSWRTVQRRRTDARGAAAFAVPAVQTGAWRVAAAPVPEALGTVSATRALTVTPAYAVVPEPPVPYRAVAAVVQPRATTRGLDLRVSAVPDAVWGEMVGATWHQGCPVGRSGLRYLTLNYYGFDGFRHRGELVVATRVVGQVRRIFTALYAAGYPIRSLAREDRFGWNRSLRGADDYASMAADNSSGFNCRQVVGQESRRSPHSYGIAIDLNTLENPDVARNGTWPHAWFADRTRRSPASIVPGGAVVRAFAGQGWHWGASFRDYQHFDITRGHD